MKKSVSLLLALSVLGLTACQSVDFPTSTDDLSEVSVVAPLFPEETEPTETEAVPDPRADFADPNGEVCILFTSDVHCGINEGFGYAGLYDVRENLERQGYATILVDDGDSVQGGVVGMLSEGDEIIELMNALEYDVAIPGNHDFDYGADRFMELVGMADFPYVSCNINREGLMMFDAYTIVEAADISIAFVGVTTPYTITSSTPGIFQDEDGNYIYDFLGDENGEALVTAIQCAVDDARADGADYVFLMAHLGEGAQCEPYTFNTIISNTTGIDAFFDGHSHDRDIVTINNLNGEPVTRYAVGTRLEEIGYLYISPDDGITDAGVWAWENSVSAPDLLHIDNVINDMVNEDLAEVESVYGEVITNIGYNLLIYDPTALDENGNPVRMIRRAETNLGDLCADAVRSYTGADIALLNGGGIRCNIDSGDVTLSDIMNVLPFNDNICVVEATGQQILNALEWGVRLVPDENGAFFQVSGISFDVDPSIPSGCGADDNGFFTGVSGTRRVQNVMVAGEPIDPDATYTVAGWDYPILQNGDGQTAFDGCNVIAPDIAIDSEVLVDYIENTLGGELGEDYANPYGQGRITILEE